MRYIGVDLHKRLVVVCVVEVQDGKRVVVERGRWSNQDTAGMESFLRIQVPFQIVVESTSCYEWFVELAEPFTDRVVLAHPRKLRLIAESTRKTDRLDAQVLAEFLALGMIPEAHRAPPRLGEHRTLVRHRCFLKRRVVGRFLLQRPRGTRNRRPAVPQSLPISLQREFLVRRGFRPGRA
jgi:transposase